MFRKFLLPLSSGWNSHAWMMVAADSSKISVGIIGRTIQHHIPGP